MDGSNYRRYNNFLNFMYIYIYTTKLVNRSNLIIDNFFADGDLVLGNN